MPWMGEGRKPFPERAHELRSPLYDVGISANDATPADAGTALQQGAILGAVTTRGPKRQRRFIALRRLLASVAGVASAGLHSLNINS